MKKGMLDSLGKKVLHFKWKEKDMVQEERVKIVSIRCLYQQQEGTLCNSKTEVREYDKVYVRDVL